MPIYRYLDLSTGHLSEEEANEVCGGHCAPFPFGDLEHSPRVIGHEYGAWVHVPEIAEQTDEEDTAALEKSRPNLAACLARARALDCNWINFDQDAGRDPELPTFDW